jgi:pyruvate,orthophosphate dikinase
MDKKFISTALEANLAETRYKDIKIPDNYQWFIDLSKKYYGIHKRANDCIIEYQHPFSNRKFVIEQLREILLTDYWFYAGTKDPEKAFSVPLELMHNLLMEGDNKDHHLMIIRTLLEFSIKLLREGRSFDATFKFIYDTFYEGFEHDRHSFIIASRYFKRYLKDFGGQELFRNKRLEITKKIFIASLDYWRETSQVEKWLEEKKDLINTDKKVIVERIGDPWFERTGKKAVEIETWEEFIREIPDYDNIAERFAETIKSFENFIEKFYFIFYLLQIPGMQVHKERLIWDLNKILVATVDEIDRSELKPFIDQIFAYATDLRKSHISSILDTFLTLGKKVIEIDDSENQQILSYFEDKLIEFGFETPGMVFVNEDWQLSVNPNHIKNIRVWLELIEYTTSGLEKLLSTLIVNLKLGGIFISDTDLFQRDITKILNSNVAPHYKKVKQLTRIFPVYFNEIGAEGEIRQVTTTMDELNYREDKLIHFLRKQVHTESNNTLIDLTIKIFRFWYDGNLEALKGTLPENVYRSIDLNSEYYAPIHKMVVSLCEMTGKTPEELLSVELDEIDALLEKIPDGNNKDKERLRDMVALYAFLKEKYSFDTVDIIKLLKRYNYIEEEAIEQLHHALEHDDFEKSLKLIYSFMEKLKEIIFDPKPSKSWENIYHKRHIAVGIPSMYGVYREPKFEAMGLTFRLEKVATRLMEKVVQNINLDYISAKTLKNIYTILDYFREGLNLDGVTNQSFNSNLMMLKYSLSSQSFSFHQYINIFQFLAEDVKRTIIKYFLKTYDVPLKIVIPQLFNPDGKLDKREEMTLINKVSEEFYRDVIAEAFLMQPLDNFVSRILESLRNMNDSLEPEMIREIMSYNSDLVISSLDKKDHRIDNQTFLGSKAYHLKNLMLQEFPVPPGFVLTTEVFRRHAAITGHEDLRKEMHDMIRKQIRNIERRVGRQLGNPDRPLLLSVRSGTAISMPGAMDTFLNVGMNDEITEAIARDQSIAWAAWDSYRRFLQSWGMAYGLERDDFDDIMLSFKEKYDIELKTDFSSENMRELAFAYKQKLEESNIEFISDLFQQLITTINLVFTSWDSERAKVYREHLQIADDWGTAVIVQKMVFGNLHSTSGTGVVFTQNPQAQRQSINLYGDYTTRSQGEDIVAGLVKPLPVNTNQVVNGDVNLSLEKRYPDIYKKIYEIAENLVNDLGYSPQEIEFTFESDDPKDLYILQIRDMDMAKSRAGKIFRTKPHEMKIAGRGIGIGGGAMNGLVAFDDEDMKMLREQHPDENIILIRPDTVPDDIGMIFDTDGLLTARGGATSHAAVTAVRLGKTAVVNCSKLAVYEDDKYCMLGDVKFRTGDKMAIDGSLGNVYQGNYPIENETGYEVFKF